MVLDEDALEAMLRRGHDREQGPLETVTTDQTEEYEVYERKQDPEAETPAAGPASAEATQDPNPDEASAATEYEESPASRPDEARAPASAHEPAAQERATHEPAAQERATQEETASLGPEGTATQKGPAAEPTESAPMADRAAFHPQDPTETRRRPQVWPPVSHSEATPPATTAAEEAPESAQPTQTHDAASHDAASPGPASRDERTHGPTDHAVPAPTTAGDGCRLAVVQALFNQEVTDMMADLAVSHARKRGAEVTHHVTVPGVFDLPLMTKRMMESDDVDAVVVIGCVVQGETRHDELITHATAKTLQEVALATGKPIGFGVTGPGMTWEQAEARIVNGKHAVEAALGQWKALAEA